MDTFSERMGINGSFFRLRELKSEILRLLSVSVSISIVASTVFEQICDVLKGDSFKSAPAGGILIPDERIFGFVTT